MNFKLLQVDTSLPPAGRGKFPDRPRVSISVSHDAVKAIEELPRRPLNLITIWGPARTGKSFFMNNLARNDDLFPVSGEAAPSTLGADMSATTCDASWLLHGTTQRESRTLSPAIGFVDVEGSADDHAEYDMLTAIPLLLLSKVIFVNWRGRPAKTDILQSLARFMETASAITETKRPNFLGHLVILLRDTPDDEESARRLIFDHEKHDGPFESEDAISSRMERNETRKRLKVAFQSVRVMCLPRPHKKINGTRIGHEEVKDKFKAKLDQVRKHIHGKLYEPHLVGEHALEGGVAFALLLGQVCAAINRRDMDPVPIRMETVTNREVQKCRTEGIEQFKARVRGLEGEVPLTCFTSNIHLGEYGLASNVKTYERCTASAADPSNVSRQSSTSSALLGALVKSYRHAALEKFRMKTQGRSETAFQATEEATLKKGLLRLSEGCRGRHETKISSANHGVITSMVAVRQEMDNQMQKIIGKIPVDDDAELRTMLENASRSAHAKVENEVQMAFSEELRAELGLSRSRLSFVLQIMEEIENLMKLNRRVKEEKGKYVAELEEQERRRNELRSQHTYEIKTMDEGLQAEWKERENKLETAQNEREEFQRMFSASEQPENNLNIFEAIGKVFEQLFAQQGT